MPRFDGIPVKKTGGRFGGEPVYEDLPVGTPTKEFARVGLPIAGDVFLTAITPEAKIAKFPSWASKLFSTGRRATMSGAGSGAGSVIGQQISEGEIDPAEEDVAILWSVKHSDWLARVVFVFPFDLHFCDRSSQSINMHQCYICSSR